jgi:hypothetical protein
MPSRPALASATVRRRHVARAVRYTFADEWLQPRLDDANLDAAAQAGFIGPNSLEHSACKLIKYLSDCSQRWADLLADAASICAASPLLAGCASRLREASKPAC